MKTSNYELLLPVGQKEMALAAIHNGADAIFIGFPGFNARGRSYDFEIQELKEIIETCHLYGVKVNLAFNIVIFEEELERVIAAIYKVLPLKPDALIVQDLGLVNLIRKIAPKQVIHASTQMTVTNDLAIALLDDLNIKRFVLGRENSLSEIKLIKSQTDKELEVFVHGALCVSYSGQCFTSESIGGRSANRGQCAQSCRFSYDLDIDGEIKKMDQKYLVSPQDLCGINEISELMNIGVTSFKVEGRLKSPEYVASVAKEYRQVIDRHLKTNQNVQVEAQAFNRLAVAYSRGFFTGWLHGVNHQKLVDGTFSAHRGAFIGQVIDYDRRLGSSITVQLDQNIELHAGDGLLWVNTVNDEEFGSFIYSIEKLSDKNKFKIGISKELKLKTIFNNLSESHYKLYLNHSQKLKKETQKSYEDKNHFKKIPIRIDVKLEQDKKLWARISDGQHQIEALTSLDLAQAHKKPLTDQDIHDEFLSLGGSVFNLDQFNIERADSTNLYIPAKELKLVRQSLVSQLADIRLSQRVTAPEVELNPDVKLDVKFDNLVSDLLEAVPSEKFGFNVLLRTKNQVLDLIDAVISNRFAISSFDTIILDFEFGRDYNDSILKLKSVGLKVGIATTRILKPQEYQNLKNIANLNPDVILIRNLGALHYFTTTNPVDLNLTELRGDFSLNVTNHLSSDYLLKKGLKSVCLSYDLNKKQVEDILSDQKNRAQSLEITMHQFMPSFHMEHCVFAAYLSQGSSYRDCGKPCEKHEIKLKDQFGNWHWIKPDHECRNTMYNSKAQTAIKFVAHWRSLGLGAVRYEALNEVGDELISKLESYAKYFSDKQTLDEALLALKTQDSYGLSEGNFDREHKYQSRKKVLL